jgi:ketosteroid isomerase-like protein
MKISFLTVSVLFLCSSLYSQDFQKEINDQVWKPFIEGFTNGDTDMFMNVHSKDLIRSPRDSKTIQTWEEYYKGTQQGNDRRESSGRKSQIELRFTERIATPAQAIDVGIYKTSSVGPDGKQRSFYGRFHVVMRKENGTWKILVDTDSSEGGTISEKEFLTAKPIE